MENILHTIEKTVAGCTCGKHNRISLETIVVERGALEQAAPYLLARSSKHVTVVADAYTYTAAAERLIHRLSSAGLECTQVMVQANHQGDVVADEPSILQVMLETPNTTDTIIAVGSGTIHDIVRLTGYKMNKSFISIPTAPSVDGFTSVGAPIILKGEKKTIPASAPIAIFADLDILLQAPQSLVAAGFCDMLGKYTSLFDWKFAHWIASEPYCPAAESITRRALTDCVKHVKEIAQRKESGIRILMNALIESGLAMLIFGQSHPASGSEHHLSHYWEMDYLRHGKKQLLHGAKVGVACMEVSKLYHFMMGKEQLLQVEAFDAEEQAKLECIRFRWEEILELLKSVPGPAELREFIRTMNGPVTPEELGISQELLDRSMKEAHQVRLNRYTMFRALNEIGASRT